MAKKKVAKKRGRAGKSWVAGMARGSGARSVICRNARESAADAQAILEWVYHAAIFDFLGFMDDMSEFSPKEFVKRMNEVERDCRKFLYSKQSKAKPAKKSVAPLKKRGATVQAMQQRSKVTLQ